MLLRISGKSNRVDAGIRKRGEKRTGLRGRAALTRRFVGVLLEEGVEQSFRPVERGASQRLDRLGEVNQTALRREVEYAKRPCYLESFRCSRPCTSTIIHEQQVSMNGQGQLNSCFFTRIDSP